MATKKTTKKRTTTKPKPKLKVTKVEKLKSSTVKITYLKVAEKFSAARKLDTIHVRKFLPEIKAGTKVNDLMPTVAMALDQDLDITLLRKRGRGPVPMADSDTVTFKKNVQIADIATADTASHVCEPSVAKNGNVIFYTGNWFAAVSLDGGTTFSYVNPFNTFPNPAGMSFCCDQVVHYVKSIDTFIWLLQYSKDGTSKNIQRIAYATTANVRLRNWRFFDITPASIGLGAGRWLDFPDLSTSSNFLYMSTNVFNAASSWTNSMVVRIRLSSFTTNVLSASSFNSTTHGSIRVAQNCATTAYFVAHNSTSAVRVFSWREASASPTFNNVSLASWSSGPFSSSTPDGRNWLQRADSRHTGVTLRGTELWCAWGAGPGGANNRPRPYIQIARINVTNMTLLENINLWNANEAIFYGALATNLNNEVGISFSMGGGGAHVGHVVGILTGTRRLVRTFTSNRGPADNKWGDYLGIRRDYPSEKLFCASGYSLRSGAGNSDATPNMTVFGRSSDV